MADWDTTLPPEAQEGALTHVEDHNSIVAALRELRDHVDELAGATISVTDVDGLQAALAGKASSSTVEDLEGRIAALEPPPED